jgi:hypothetical protein
MYISSSMYARMRVTSAYVRVFACTYTNERISVCVCIYVCMYVCMHACIYIYVFLLYPI